MTENDLQPTDSDPAWSWMALNLIYGIGYKTIRELIEHLGSVQELLKAQPEMLISVFKLSAKLAGLIAKTTQIHSFLIEKRILGETPGIWLFCPDSSGYPLSFKKISTPLGVLYWWVI